MTLEERQKSIMMLEGRVSELETTVFPEGIGGSNISDAVMALYGSTVQFQILLGDFFHDLSTISSKLMEEIAEVIPEEIIQQLKENMEDDNVVPFPKPTDLA